MLGRMIPCLRDYDGHRNVIQSAAKVESTVQQVFACDEIGSNKAMKNNFVVIAGKEENENLLRLATVFLLFTLKMDCTEKEYGFLQYMECKRPLDDIESLDVYV